MDPFGAAVGSLLCVALPLAGAFAAISSAPDQSRASYIRSIMVRIENGRVYLKTRDHDWSQVRFDTEAWWVPGWGCYDFTVDAGFRYTKQGHEYFAVKDAIAAKWGSMADEARWVWHDARRDLDSQCST